MPTYLYIDFLQSCAIENDPGMGILRQNSRPDGLVHSQGACYCCIHKQKESSKSIHSLFVTCSRVQLSGMQQLHFSTIQYTFGPLS